MSQGQYDHIVKLMLIGNSNVGKTAFMHRYCQNTYNPKLPTTIGLQYQQKLVDTNGRKYLVQLWDTAGQQRFRNITPSYFRSAMGIILCYSVEDRQSFNNIAVWLKQIRKYAEEDLPVIIVGNKCDLTRRQVLEKEGQTVADMYKLDFVEASAKEDINVNLAVSKLIEKVQCKIKDVQGLKLTKIYDKKAGFCRC